MYRYGVHMIDSGEYDRFGRARDLPGAYRAD